MPGPGGRPLKFTPEEIEERAEKWMKSGKRRISSLAKALGFNGREQMAQYAARPEFRDTILRARLEIEEEFEDLALERDTSNGARFLLQCMGYQPIDVVHHTHEVGEETRGSVLDAIDAAMGVGKDSDEKG